MKKEGNILFWLMVAAILGFMVWGFFQIDCCK